MAFVDENGLLHDDVALGVVRVVERENVRRSLVVEHSERVAHFARRIAELGRTPQDVLITVLNADDPNGRFVADQLMPGQDWQAIRDAGLTPFARGLAGRESLQELLESSQLQAAEELRAISGIAVLCMDRGHVFAFDLERELQS